MQMNLESYKIPFLNIIYSKPPEDQMITLSCQQKLISQTDAECSVRLAATFTLDSEADKEEKTFCIRIVLIGDFSYENGNNEILRRKGAEILFPFLRSHLAAAMGAIGIEPMIIPAPDFAKSKSEDDEM